MEGRRKKKADERRKWPVLCVGGGRARPDEPCGTKVPPGKFLQAQVPPGMKSLLSLPPGVPLGILTLEESQRRIYIVSNLIL